ncbi:MAG: hypothetical protein ACXADH_03975 [Candidatus Kariarchaeaceae archaeon]|jgi:hypothetical protein
MQEWHDANEYLDWAVSDEERKRFKDLYDKVMEEISDPALQVDVADVKRLLSDCYSKGYDSGYGSGYDCAAETYSD